MSQRLVARFIVTVGGFTFRNGNEPSALEQPISLTITHRDDEASLLTLVIKDYDFETCKPFPIFNALPNPRRSELIPVEAFMGWDGEGLVKAFEGILARKRLNYQLSQTTLTAVHNRKKLNKRGKVDTKKNLTLKEFITQKFAEEGIKAQFHASVAGDAALNTPVEFFLQPGDSNWDVVNRWLRANGYITNTIKADVVVIRRSKSDGRVVQLVRGGDEIIELSIDEEQKFDHNSGRMKGHAHEVKPGKRWSRFFAETKDSSRYVEAVTPAIGKEAKGPHVVSLARESVRNRAKRRAIEGDELRGTIRLNPYMRNEELLVVRGFGEDADGGYQSSMVEHRLGQGPARTSFEGWRPA